MKFVALALALLLAVGSQAASLQADAPSQLDQIRSAVDVYLTQARESAIKALDQLDGTEYESMKGTVAQRLNDMHTQLKQLQSQVSPMTDSVVSSISDATAEVRASIVSDIEALKTELEPMRAKLREVVNKHLEEYRTHMEPVLKEYQAKHNEEMEALKTKMEPIMAELRQKIATNVEETKEALVPIVEAVRTKLTQRLESLKEMAAPFVEEYKEYLKKSYDNAQNINAEELEQLRGKIQPLAEEIKTKFTAIVGLITETFNKNSSN
ncbi:apolipoprotein A-Ib [Kryptolebias marmoratus]|uniref:apolipoprotein A-Ib n=1 Tax=Kryptolebias marmoratus TaxID=37003 RepID=UPI0007F8B24B|nr:apolipoprotein A-Ib [Kryptolebias marmoratus]